MHSTVRIIPGTGRHAASANRHHKRTISTEIQLSCDRGIDIDHIVLNACNIHLHRTHFLIQFSFLLTVFLQKLLFLLLYLFCFFLIFLVLRFFRFHISLQPVFLAFLMIQLSFILLQLFNFHLITVCDSLQTIHLTNHINKILGAHNDLHIHIGAGHRLFIKHAIGDDLIPLIDILLLLFDFHIQLGNLTFNGTNIGFIDFDILIQFINHGLQLLHNGGYFLNIVFDCGYFLIQRGYLSLQRAAQPRIVFLKGRTLLRCRFTFLSNTAFVQPCFFISFKICCIQPAVFL